MSRKDLPLPPRDKDQRGSLTFAQPQPGPGDSLVRLAERDEGDEVGVLIGGLSNTVLAQGLFSAKQ